MSDAPHRVTAWLVFIALTYVACGPTSTVSRTYPSGTADPRVAILVSPLGIDNIPFSLICNAVVLDDHQLVTAAHCLDEPIDRLSVAVGGTSVCDPEGWTVMRIDSVATADERDLALLQVTDTLDAAKPDNPSSGVWIHGYGRDQGRSETCDPIRMPAFRAPDGHCQPNPSRVLAPADAMCLVDVVACAGLSGSPVVLDGSVVGITVLGSSCHEAGGFVQAAWLHPLPSNWADP